MKYEMALILAQEESEKQLAERIVELYETIADVQTERDKLAERQAQISRQLAMAALDVSDANGERDRLAAEVDEMAKEIAGLKKIKSVKVKTCAYCIHPFGDDHCYNCVRSPALHDNHEPRATGRE